MAEDKKKSRAEKLYDKPKGKETPKPKAEEKTEKKADTSTEAAPAKAAEPEHPHKAMFERHAAARDAMLKTHETERRDLHGSHKAEHRKMADRHQKAHAALADQHMAEMTTGGEPAAAGPNGQAPAVAAVPGAPAAA